MKRFTFLLFFSTFILHPCLSQQKTESPQKNQIVVGAGIGFQFFANTFRLATFNIGLPIGQYQQIGFRFSKIFPGESYNYEYFDRLTEGSYEVGLHAKFFPHGRFTGHKTGFFLGPDIRVGERKYIQYQYNPLIADLYELVTVKYQTAKFMLCWGAQWHFGRHAVLEIDVPMGMENIRYKGNSNPYPGGYFGTFSEDTFVMLPTLTLGFGF